MLMCCLDMVRAAGAGSASVGQEDLGRWAKNVRGRNGGEMFMITTKIAHYADDNGNGDDDAGDKDDDDDDNEDEDSDGANA